MSYGTGAIMAVPAHDERDFAFAKKYDLPIIPVIQPVGASHNSPLQAAYVGDGVMVNSAQFNGTKVNTEKGRKIPASAKSLTGWQAKASEKKRSIIVIAIG